MKVAVIGTGISGLAAAYLLAPHCELTVFEKNAYAGGHSRTLDIPSGTTTIPVDTGFIVFNDRNYPNLVKLFERLDVPVQKSKMSFGVSVANGWLEYASCGLWAQKVNLLRPAYYRMLYDILRFNRRALALLETEEEMTLLECLNRLNMGEWFQRYYLLAMGAAIWSCPLETIMQFPARTFLQFFKNHGLLSVNDHPQWYTVTGGSRDYVARLTTSFQDKIKLNCGVERVLTTGEGVQIKSTDGQTEVFDHAIFACHADEALQTLDDPSVYHDTIGAFTYQNNQIVVHGDDSFMPRTRACWASWVYLSESFEDQRSRVSLSYWMNNLQGLDPQTPVFVTLNPGRRPADHLIYDEHTFTHPVFDFRAIAAQKKLSSVQGQNGIWFCGAYQRYGFHEDGLLSAIHVVKKMGVSIPWE